MSNFRSLEESQSNERLCFVKAVIGKLKSQRRDSICYSESFILMCSSPAAFTLGASDVRAPRSDWPTDPSLPEKVERFPTFGRRQQSRQNGLTHDAFRERPHAKGPHLKFNENRRRILYSVNLVLCIGESAVARLVARVLCLNGLV